MTYVVNTKPYERTAVNGSDPDAARVVRPLSKTPNSAVNPTGRITGETGDVINNGEVSEEVKAKLAEAKEKLQSLRFSNGFISGILGNVGYLDEKDPEKQLKILDALITVTDYYIKKQKDTQAQGFNIKHAITLTTRNFIDQVEKGNVENFEEYLELTKVGDTEFKKAKTQKQKIKAIEREKNRIIVKINKKRQIDLKKCKTAEQKAAVNKKYDDLTTAVLEQAQLELIRLNSKDDANVSVYIQEGKNQANAHKLAIQAFLEEYQEEVANSFTHEFEMELLQTYYENGDPISSEEYGNIVETISEYKSEEAIQQYQADAEAYANEHPETPWYTKEHAEAEAKGIETGIASNSNIKSNSAADNTKNVNNVTDEATTDRSYGNYNQNQAASTVQAYSNNTVKPEEPEKKQEEIVNGKNNNSTAKDIALEIKTGNITMLEAINLFHEKAYDAIFEDPELFARNKAIAAIHVNNFRKDLDKLLKLSNFSSAIELIVRNISPTIKDKYAHEIKLSAITKDAIFGKEENNNAAA